MKPSNSAKDDITRNIIIRKLLNTNIHAEVISKKNLMFSYKNCIKIIDFTISQSKPEERERIKGIIRKYHFIVGRGMSEDLCKEIDKEARDK